MKKVLSGLIFLFLFVSFLQADDQSNRLGIGVYTGPCWLWQGHGDVIMTSPEPPILKPISSPGPIIGGKLRWGVVPAFAIMLSGQYGEIHYQGVPDPNDRTTYRPCYMKTYIMPVELSAIINLAPTCKLNPYLMIGSGITYWKAHYHVPDNPHKIIGIGDETKGSVKFGGGLEYFVTERLSFDALMRYSYIFTNIDIYPTFPTCPKQKVNSVLDLQVGLNFYLGGNRDIDADGIPNKQDQCPNDPEDKDGFQDEDGCPDLDNDQDGVADTKDKCDNTTAGVKVDSTGCPIPMVVKKTVKDADQDGLLDDKDKCPNDPEDKDGFQDEDGCPDLDNDKDNVVDTKDKCSNTPLGVQVDENGCPLQLVKDTDQDGIIDDNDKCPTLKEDMDGFEDTDGCPDLDNDQDGIPDSTDKCPKGAEDIDSYQDQDGCPDPDNDQDGILDKQDKCPGADVNIQTKEVLNGFQDEDGCPDEKPKVIEKGAKMILRGVNFKTGSAALTPESYPILDEVYNSLAAYPEVKVEIRGYTDNRGGADKNLALSRKRAESVMSYLVNRGIDKGRISAKGLGPADPVASNGTEDGRAQNRRIEFQRVD